MLGNVGFGASLIGYKTIVYLFLGTLRDYEVERVQERVGQAIIETLLAMTIFRHKMDTIPFISRFVLLAFVKMFHWLAQDRVDFIETTPNTTLLQHVRLVGMVVWLGVVDVLLLNNALGSVFQVGISAHLLFAFEYSMQTTLAMAVFMKYVFSLVDMLCVQRHGSSWRGKSVAIFYVDLTKDMVHLITYSAFFFVVFSTYGIPIHLIREIYWTFRNFTGRVRAFLRFRQISSTMEGRFPTATEEDLVRGDRMCIVCREDMAVEMGPKRLPCGHCFHVDCLKSWLERQQNCPICRRLIPAVEEEEAPGATGGAVEVGVRVNDEQAAAREDGGAGPRAVDGPDGRDGRDGRDGAVENRLVAHPLAGIDANEDVGGGAGRDDDRVANAREAFLRRLEGLNGSPGSGDGSDQHAAGPVEPVGPVEPAPLQPSHAETPPSPPAEPTPRNRAPAETPTTQAQAPLPLPLPAPAPPPVLLFPTPGTLLFDMPAFHDDPTIGDALRLTAARDLDLHPTDEQHERALAIAKASAHAAAVAAATTEVLERS